MAIEMEGDIRENEELNEEKKIILEKLLDRDEEEPEVGERIFVYSKQSFIMFCIVVRYLTFFMVHFFFTL